MTLEEMKARYLRHYRESPLLVLFLTLMGVSLLTTICLSAVSRDYFLAVLGKMSQHVFMDYFWSVSDSMNNPYSELHVIYPPLAVCIYALIGHYTLPFVDGGYGDPYLDMYNSQVPMMVFALLMCIGLFLLMTLVKHLLSDVADEKKSVLFVFLTLLSFPVVIALQNGNSIIYMAFFVMLFLLGYDSENKWIRYASYISLGIVTGFKLMPAILGLLILRDRKYKEFILCVIIVAVISMAPVVFTDGTIPMLIHNIVTIPSDLGGSVNNFSKIFHQLSEFAGMDWVKTVGTVLTVCVIVLILLVLTLDRRMKLWKVMTLTACLFVLGPGVGTPYLYIYLIPATVFMLRSEKEATRENLMYIVLLALPLLLVPMDLMPMRVAATLIMMFLLIYEGLKDIYGIYLRKSSEETLLE